MKLSYPENIDFQRIRNIIFDWGGVITNIDYQKTVDAFKKLGIDNFREYFSQHIQNDLFTQFEIGAISTDELHSELLKNLKPGTTKKHIDDAWCAMLLDTPLKNIEMVKAFGENFRIFLLSNTNEIHVEYYNSYLKNSMNIDYPKLFEKAYYSHSIGRRKPNSDIFEYVLSECNLLAEETLFIDDTEINVDTASSLGIISLYLKPGTKLENIYKAWKNLN